MSYDESFFEENLESSLRSARVCVPKVLRLVAPKSVVDIGCGVGAWLKVFSENGIDDVFGIDNSGAKGLLQIPIAKFMVHDLTTPITLRRKFDLVVCLEVAEHLPSSCAKQLVDTLTELGPVVLFSAAIPHQGGVHHVNEQWPDYWAGLFHNKQYEVIDCIRREIWSDRDVGEWYSQNILLYAEASSLRNFPVLLKEHERTSKNQLSLVHPSMYLHYVNPRTIPVRTVLGALPYLPARVLHFIAEKVKDGGP